MPRLALLLAVLGLSFVISRDSHADMLFVSAPSVASPGETFTAAVRFSTTQALNVQAFDLALAFDDLKLFNLSNLRLSPATASAFSATMNTSIAGRIVSSASANSSGIDLANGTVIDLLLFDLTVKPDASGVTDINLLANLSSTITSVNENLLLTPAPTNGFDPGIDARIVLPEPSSAALIAAGLVGGSCLFARNVRNRRLLAQV